jgi:hypothetical protein
MSWPDAIAPLSSVARQSDRGSLLNGHLLPSIYEDRRSHYDPL